jgi:UTP--glucose-1-phosphate uridylyltransferase
VTHAKRVQKAVIPAAGLGTRFLPATKSQPKEMLPVVDKPSIQYVVEEAVAAGLTDILIITGRGKRAIEDHFDRNFELEHYLEQSEKLDLLAEVQVVNELADIHYIRQRDPLGLGHAVSVAREHVGNEPFAVILGDDIMVDDGELLRSMIEVHDREQASVLALLDVKPQEISAYGCAESVFTPGIFDAINRITPGVGGELQLTDAIGLLLESEPVFGRVFTHGRYDIGQKLDFLRANIEIALGRDDLGPDLADYLRALVKERLS